VAGIGVLGTLTAGIAGGLLAQRWARRREDKAWARERERERERWAREDEARTYEHRREVFEDFYQAVKALARRAYDHGYGFDDTPSSSRGSGSPEKLINNLRVPVSPCGLYSPRTWQFSRDPA